MWRSKRSCFPVEGILPVVWRVNSLIHQPPVREGRVRQRRVCGCAGQEEDAEGGGKTSWESFKEGPELGRAQRRWRGGV